MIRADWKFLSILAAPMMIIAVAIGFLASPLADKIIVGWSATDLDLRSKLIVNSFDETLVQSIDTRDVRPIARRFEALVRDERLFAMGLCYDGNLAISSKDFFKDFECPETKLSEKNPSHIVLPSGKEFYVSIETVSSGNVQAGNEARESSGVLVLVHDLDYVRRRSTEFRRYIIAFTAVAAFSLLLVTFVAGEIIRRLWAKAVRAGLRSGTLARRMSGFSHITPIIADIRSLIAEIESERKVWNAEAVRQIVSEHMHHKEFLVVSNREPYLHNKRPDGAVEIIRPASGLVTSLEPVVSACAGTWIAHGSGSADKETSDRNGRVAVPPDNPSFTLRRIWLDDDERQGYYNGFANEALWPLCLLTHTRPVFRSADWRTYNHVNAKFADSVAAEAKTSVPVVLVQDYHFSLLPRMVRDRLPESNIASFWHIPWPNPEIFSICPWKQEILDGLLGSHIVGFHTAVHAQNFMACVQNTLEARVDFVKGNVSYRGAVTKVASYPMSVEWPDDMMQDPGPVDVCRAAVLAENGLSGEIKIGVGVDRLDYTKGLIERFQAIERLAELSADVRNNFCFIQISSPSRGDIQTYKDYWGKIQDEVARINEIFGRRLIILRDFHHNKSEVYKYYRAADLCFVSSLHDGMNLVAKEFISARDDGGGVLVLSRFTGAAESLPDALLVNPYHIDECADILARALYMHPQEQRERMAAMRRHVRENNIYKWAGQLLLDCSEISRINNLIPQTISAAPPYSMTDDT